MSRFENADPRAPLLCRATWLPVLAGCALVTCSTGATSSEPIQGFLEPFRTIHVATAEPGVLVEVLVEEGDEVAAGQALAKLDDDLLLAQLAIAELQMKATGLLQAAQADLTLHEQRWRKLVELEREGQAYPEEVQRARADKDAAEGRLLAEREEHRLLQKQYEKIQLQIAKRTIKSPVVGAVAAVLKNEGEYVSPADPVVAKVVVLHPLRATFFLPRNTAEKLAKGQRVGLMLPRLGASVPAQVELVSPLTDAESGAVAVKVLLDNAQGEYYSGERCVLEMN